MNLISLLLLYATLLSTALAKSKSCPNTLKTKYPAPIAAEGWSYRLVANGLSRPRSIAFDSGGGLLVLSSRTGVQRLTFDDHGGSCLGVKSKSTVVDDSDLNHGLALSPDGTTLYASTPDAVLRWSYNATAGKTTSSSSVLMQGMANGGHVTRTILVASNGTLLVSRGSAANADSAAQNISTGHCQIRAFAPTSDAVDFMKGTLVGWGLRNSVGIAEHPAVGGIWSVENSVDNLERAQADVHNDNPAEELNYHGNLSHPAGNNHGYPVCYTLWGTQDFPNIGNLTTGDQFAADGAEGQGLVGAVTDDACNDPAKFAGPVLSFQAHTAPLDILFDKTGETAYVSFHGSWNRDSPVGYSVATVPFSASSGRPVPGRNSTNGATDIFHNAHLDKCPGSCFRPVGLAWDGAGRLWVASDSTGEIFVLVHGGDEWAGKNAATRRKVERAWVVLVAAVAVLQGLI